MRENFYRVWAHCSKKLHFSWFQGAIYSVGILNATIWGHTKIGALDWLCNPTLTRGRQWLGGKHQTIILYVAVFFGKPKIFFQVKQWASTLFLNNTQSLSFFFTPFEGTRGRSWWIHVSPGGAINCLGYNNLV